MNITKITGIKTGSRDRIRELVRIRDNHSCQNCGVQWFPGQRRFDVHHIDCDNKRTHFCDKLAEINNMVTLCHKCHLNIPDHRAKMRGLRISG
jgi:5-methylcytosine-specific restriction endonuclease McrA